MNSRPLTYEGADPRDEPMLKPNHFLVGQLGGQLAPQATDDIAFNPKNRWRLIQNLVRLFWKRWREDYLSTLHTRKKWREAKENLKVGDVVLVVDQNHAVSGIWVEWKKCSLVRMDVCASSKRAEEARSLYAL